MSAPVLPEGVTEIKPFAFAGATFVSITLNVSVTVIGAGAFEGADLGEVRYGGSIADWVGIDFENASANPLNGGSLVIGGEKVSDLVIPEGVTAIKPFAFAGATFVSVTINVTVTVIGDSAFENCTVSASVSFTGTAEDWEKVDVGGENGLLEDVDCHTHSYQSEVTKDPTCTEEGVRTFTCSCGDTYTEPIATIDHNFVDGKCTMCGKSENAWDGSVASGFASGNGSAQNPYVIATGAQLAYFAQSVNGGRNFNGLYVVLTEDLDLGGREWTPIGVNAGSYDHFTGYFDGQGHTVSNFTITEGHSGYIGLFGKLWGFPISDLGVTDFTINVSFYGTIYAGGLVGYLDGGGTLSYCYAEGTITVTSTNSYGFVYAGGLAGSVNSGTLEGCYARVPVTASSPNSAYAGGLAGHLTNGTVVADCFAAGDVTGASTTYGTTHYGYAGGLVGYTDDGTVNDGGTIRNSYATGNVSARANVSGGFSYAGGLVGLNVATLENSFALGDVSATGSYRNAGGLVGYNNGTISGGYRSADQTVTNSNNTLGIEADPETLSSTDFLTGTLEWSHSIWTFTESGLPNLDHHWNGGSVIRPATCLEEGEILYTCTVCGEAKTIVLPKTAHHYVNGVCTVCSTPLPLWDGSIAESFESGSGTELDPFVIATSAQLAYFAQCVNGGISFEGQYLILSTDLSLGGLEWTPIGLNADSNFMGRFDGQGFTVSNFRISKAYSGTAYIGLFGYVGANGYLGGLGVVEFTIDMTGDGDIYAGALAGYLADRANAEACYASGSLAVHADSIAYAGGLMGYADGSNSDIECCYAEVSVFAETGGAAYVGGLMGQNDRDVYNCYASGSVSVYSGGEAVIGGLAGQNNGGEFYYCYASGNISTDERQTHIVRAGGLLGRNYRTGGRLVRCFATGDLILFSSSIVSAGGLLGLNSATSSYLSYRSTEQSITVTKNGVISGSTNSDGSTEAEATLISEAFLTGTLGWSDQIWSFAGGQLPTLKL